MALTLHNLSADMTDSTCLLNRLVQVHLGLDVVMIAASRTAVRMKPCHLDVLHLRLVDT